MQNELIVLPEEIQGKLLALPEGRRPCPFCGGTEFSLIGVDGRQVFCDACESRGPWVQDGTQAIHRWNRALRAEMERLENEANWLALVLANVGCGVPESEYIDMDINGMSPPAPEHWREAARKAVEETK